MSAPPRYWIMTLAHGWLCGTGPMPTTYVDEEYIRRHCRAYSNREQMLAWLRAQIREDATKDIDR